MSTTTTNRTTIRCLCEGALMTAIAVALSYVKFKFLPGGSVSLVMVPIILFSVRWGLGQGLVMGAAFGTLKALLGGISALTLGSLLLDYTVAYMFVGFAGLMRGKRFGLTVGCLIGCFARFIIHFISGLTIYKMVEPTELLGITFTSPFLFSVVYNASYMLPSTILCLVACLLLEKPMERYLPKVQK